MILHRRFLGPPLPSKLDLGIPSVLVQRRFSLQTKLCQSTVTASTVQLQPPRKVAAKQPQPTVKSPERPGQQPSGSPAAERRARSRKKKLAEKPFGPPSGTQRLAKVLAGAGVSSRRAAEDLIFDGQVTVNGKIVLVPQTFVDAGKDEVRVKGQKPIPQTPVKRLVVDIFQDWVDKEWKRDHLSGRAIPPRLFTVGRLDSQTTGLIFVTNDGPWAQSVQHPSSALTKEYVVTTTEPFTARQLDTIAAGCEVDGAFVAPASLSLVTDQRNKLRIVVSEGRNREVRRLVENAGLDVGSLKRVRIGGYRMERELGLGQYKLLKAHELRRVFDRTRQGAISS
ncbi:hypothetical protein WJX73_000978 [Symbiochloris irregularis]|uniref:RNA-binding S4 domain-containing protein n=1 Tax=Symbiochloris irregularis TaxID=706552 RepID=A0AAW1NXP9_9CHLO